MYGLKSEPNAVVCHGCLSADRTLSPLVDYDLYFAILGNKEPVENLNCFNILLCWECTALLRSTAAFRRRLQNAQYYLKIAHNGHISPKPLSTLKSNHRQGYDYIIEETEVTIEPKPDIDLFTDNTELDIKQEIDFDFQNDYSDDKYAEEKVEKKIKKEKKRVKGEKGGALKIDNGYNFDNVELYFTKVQLSETEVEESLAKERDDNDFVSRPHKCNECGMRFAYKADLRSHSRVNHIKRCIKIKCPVCGIGHTSHPDLVLHWRRSHPVNRCGACQGIVERDADRAKHLRLHKFRYKCVQCDIDFPDRLLYRHHETKLHSQYVCDHCGRRTVWKRTLERHIISYHLPSRCAVCGVLFKSLRRRARHAAAVHGAPGAAAAYCVECDASFATRARYARHLATAVRHRPAKKESIPCPECGKVFTRKIYMRNHVKLFHTNDSKHHCGICNKNFVNGFALRSHSKYVHEKAPKPKTKVCNVCGRAFGTNKILSNHMRTHTGERPFACARCPAAFAQQVALRAHCRAVHKEK